VLHAGLDSLPLLRWKLPVIIWDVRQALYILFLHHVNQFVMMMMTMMHATFRYCLQLFWSL